LQGAVTAGFKGGAIAARAKDEFEMMDTNKDGAVYIHCHILLYDALV
jgi:hypothetical protein